MQITRKDGVIVLRFLRDIDMEEAVHIKNTVTALIDQDAHHIVLDFERVQHLNAMGLGILADRLRFARAAHGDLRLAGLNPGLQNIFALTGTSPLFRIYPHAEAAVQSYQVCEQFAA